MKGSLGKLENTKEEIHNGYGTKEDE